MAILISPDGFSRVVSPQNGHDFALEEITRYLNGGYMEVVTIVPGEYRMIVDEDGYRKQLPLNKLASVLYNGSHHSTSPDYYPVVGPALLCKWEEVE